MGARPGGSEQLARLPFSCDDGMPILERLLLDSEFEPATVQTNRPGDVLMTIVMIVLAMYSAAWCALAVTGRRGSDIAGATPLGVQTFGSEAEPMRPAA